MSLWIEIEDKLHKYNNQIISDEERRYTFIEFLDVINCFSDKLRGLKCCAIVCKSELLASIALLACISQKVTAVPLSERYGEKHCQKIIDMVGPEAIITDRNNELCIDICDDSSFDTSCNATLIMCTSGTTGKPKGAMLSEENILTNVNDICDYFDINQKDIILIARPLYHCAVLTGEFLASIFKGVNIVFRSGQFNPIKILGEIEKNNITIFCGTPTMINIMAKYAKGENSLTTICVSGECLRKGVGETIKNAFPDARIYHVYGLTEACPRVTYLPPQHFAEHCDCVGLPLRSVHIKLVKENGSIAQKGEEGVLWIRGGNVMKGYYNSPSHTEKVLKDGWLCTGDIAVITESGFLKIKGRADDLIIYAGMNIYPAEIEGVLRQDSRVKDVIVYGVNHSLLGVQIAAKVSGNFKDAEEIRMLCKELLPPFQVPSVISFVSELPKNGSGKIIRGGYDA